MFTPTPTWPSPHPFALQVWFLQPHSLLCLLDFYSLGFHSGRPL
ncbi:hypothetical protein CORC01_03184 [Colletotrichum orchidophilum]|uniref:Uncharacterized protein n=1 Tax=Colletotrichum orchidophilum TaxID=1209926 RepID=A0A1G4BJF3_9PEZI|nr:uncharacterized protein CORC01_03184 [Colletotrichum orchidophilum]OHF01428.1 hypothetical protein CORC01_03184 [Colletotrichum orchidophilum]